LQSLLVPAIYAHDFRLDYDRMEVFKTLPIRSANLVLGQVLTPVPGPQGDQSASGLRSLSSTA
jgi:hypothetical protein